MSASLFLWRFMRDVNLCNVVQVQVSKYLTDQWRVETPCRSRHFAIHPRLTYHFFCSFSYLVVRLLLCGGVPATSWVRVETLLKLRKT